MLDISNRILVLLIAFVSEEANARTRAERCR
jgi:hypothetical protein